MEPPPSTPPLPRLILSKMKCKDRWEARLGGGGGMAAGGGGGGWRGGAHLSHYLSNQHPTLR